MFVMFYGKGGATVKTNNASLGSVGSSTSYTGGGCVWVFNGGGLVCSASMFASSGSISGGGQGGKWDDTDRLVLGGTLYSAVLYGLKA